MEKYITHVNLICWFIFQFTLHYLAPLLTNRILFPGANAPKSNELCLINANIFLQLAPWSIYCPNISEKVILQQLFIYKKYIHIRYLYLTTSSLLLSAGDTHNLQENRSNKIISSVVVSYNIYLLTSYKLCRVNNMRSKHDLFNMEKYVCTYAKHYNTESIEINELLELWIQVTLSIPYNLKENMLLAEIPIHQEMCNR